MKSFIMSHIFAIMTDNLNCKCCNRELNTSKARRDPLYVTHLHNLRNIKPLIDNKCPNVKFRKGRAHETQKLAQQIVSIQCTKGRIDSHNPHAGRSRSQFHKTLHKIETIEKENVHLYQKLKQAKATAEFRVRNLVKCWQRNLAKMKYNSKYPYTAKTWNQCQPDDISDWLCMMHCPTAVKRTQIKMEYSVENGPCLGHMTVLLFNDIVPKLVAHFLRQVQCKHARSDGTSNNREYCLIGTKIQRIYSNVYAEFAVGNAGDDDHTKYEDSFDENDFLLPVNYTGSLGMMIGNINDKIDSKYILTFKSLTVLNGICAVFGRVIHGWDVLRILEKYGKKNGSLMENVYISDCCII